MNKGGAGFDLRFHSRACLGMVVPKFLCFVEVKFANCHAEPWRHFALSRPSLSLSGKFVPTDGH